MGDASVALVRSEGRDTAARLSPLPMGDASVAQLGTEGERANESFQSPSHGGRFCCTSLRPDILTGANVSVPFPWGTLLLRCGP